MSPDEHERFSLRNGRVIDDLTGFSYSNLDELVKLLNMVNNRADRIARLYYSLLHHVDDEDDDLDNKVWMVPPIPKGERLTIATYDGDVE